MPETALYRAEQDGQHPCDYCGLVFARTRSLDVHMKRAHNPKATVECPEGCGKKFTNKAAIKKHLLSHRPMIICKIFMRMGKNIFECPVCLTTPGQGSPIYLCCHGHSLCHECKSRVKTCPQCRGDMTNMRNHDLEHILEHYTKK